MHQSLPFCVIPSHCRIGLARVGDMPETVGVHACPSSKTKHPPSRRIVSRRRTIARCGLGHAFGTRETD